jgi:hypothetical protein
MMKIRATFRLAGKDRCITHDPVPLPGSGVRTMPEYPSTCIMCRAAGVIDWPDFGEGDPVEGAVWRSALTDEQYERQSRMDDCVESVESKIKSGRQGHLCEACHDKVEAKFRRDDRNWDGTLAEVLHVHNRQLLAALSESCRERCDPDDHLVRELFPAVEVPRPAYAKLIRSQPAVSALLVRIGKPVAYFDPALDEDGEGPYVLYLLNGEGKVCSDYIEAHDLVSRGDVACALDYARDGTLLKRDADD